MIKKIDHIGIAVGKTADAKDVYEGLLGLRLASTDEVPTQRVRTAFYPCADVRLELLEPTSPESAIAKFLEKRGEGLHHIAFEVDDVRAELARLKSKGVALIDEQPRPGAHQTQIAFLHPKSTRGVLVELVQRPKGH
jgi:methylmalonyl-CoA/ethylmalonyl-CoA epimerase